MALNYDKIFATAANKTANSTTIVATASATVTVGQWVLVCIAKDNTNTAGANTTEMSVADSAGNTYTRVLERAIGGSAQAGTTVGLFLAQVTTQITSASTTITVTLGGTSANNDAQAFVGYAFTKATSGTVTATLQSSTSASSTSAADPGAITLSSLPSRDYLFFHVIGWEGIVGDTWAADADYAQKTGSHTSGSSAATNQSVIGSVRTATLTTDTFDGALTTDRNAAQVFAAFYEVITNPVMPSALGTFSLAGQDAILKAARLLTSAPGSFTFSGQSATLRRGFTLTASVGSFTFTGQDATLTYTPVIGYTLTASVGSFIEAGQAATLTATRLLTATAGTFTESGQAATLRAARALTSAVGTFTFTGQAAGLSYQQPGNYVLTGSGGVFTFSGQDATLTITAAGQDYTLAAGTGTFIFTGGNVTFRHAEPIDHQFAVVLADETVIPPQAVQESGQRVLASSDVVVAQATQQSGQRVLSPEAY